MAGITWDVLGASGVIEPGHHVLASGNHAPEKAELEVLAANRGLLLGASYGMANLALRELGPELDFIVTVGEGANAYRPDIVDFYNLFSRDKKPRVKVARGVETSYTTIDGQKDFFVKPEYLDAIKSPKSNKIGVFEDVLTRYTNSGLVSQLLAGMGFEVVGIVAILNSGGFGHVTGKPEIKGHALVNHKMIDHKPDACPQCKAGEPITEKSSKLAA